MKRSCIAITGVSVFSYLRYSVCKCVWSVHDYTDLTATDNPCEFYLPFTFCCDSRVCCFSFLEKKYSNVDKTYLFHTASHDTLTLSVCYCLHLFLMIVLADVDRSVEKTFLKIYYFTTKNYFSWRQ